MDIVYVTVIRYMSRCVYICVDVCVGGGGIGVIEPRGDYHHPPGSVRVGDRVYDIVYLTVMR